jgi:hypothetical protein
MLQAQIDIIDEAGHVEESATILVHDKPPRLVRVYNQQRIVFDDPPVPPWLATALRLA